MADAITYTVTPIHGEPLRFHVSSASSRREHLVDLEERGFTGRCTCDNYEMRLWPSARKGLIEPKLARCKHIRAAREHLLDKLLEGIAGAANGKKR